MTEFPEPSWLGMFAGVLGRTFVFLAMAAYFLSAFTWVVGGKKDSNRIGVALFWLGMGFVVATFAIHVTLLLTRQYQYFYVFTNTQNDMPFAYRLSAAWAAQEGSFLLWTLTSALFTAIAAKATGKYRKGYTIAASVVLIVMLGILAYESPFKLIPLEKELLAELPKGQTMVMPVDGMGLNPVLQNYWMVIHPWVIFLGFGSLLVLFAWSVSALFSRDFKSWIPTIRPWAIFSMLSTGIGLTMGGLWAYETLGWGGFWAWDPVENVSLVPFLGATAFVHSLYVQTRRAVWARWNLLFGALPFFWFVYGTYLTRSGALTNVSVHSFAKMDEKAHVVLLTFVIALSSYLLFHAFRAFTKPIPETENSTGDRGIGFAIGIAMLYGVALMAAIGMSVPFFAALFGQTKEVVKESVYNKIVVYPFIPAMIAMAIVPFLGWKKTKAKRWQTLSNLFFLTTLLFGGVVFALVFSGLTMDGTKKMPVASLMLFFALIWICMFSLVANGARAWERIWNRAGRIGPFLTHMGVALLLLGLIVSRAFEKTAEGAVANSSPLQLIAGPAKYLAVLEKQPTVRELLTRENRLRMSLIDLVKTNRKITFEPIVYFILPMNRDEQPQAVIRPYIHRDWFYDLYLTVGGPQAGYATNIELKPGEKKVLDDFTLEYLEKTRSGQPGQPGTRFGVRVRVTYRGNTVLAHPEIEIGEEGRMIRHQSPVSDELLLSLDALRAEDHTAVLSLNYPEPYYPVEFFFKPLTILVWLGAGIMTLGGFLAIGRSRYELRKASESEDAIHQTFEIEDSSRESDVLQSGIRR
ncbi:MAG TPA: cytochrome c biogenesis protein CcsA [Fimbriimonadales bacterium]|nr:cytochrome c biogenesis protein CcsA [Fimbriimonadales bacterium]